MYFSHILFFTFLFITSQTLKLRQQQQKLTDFKLLIVGTNDIHGTAYPTLLSRKDTGQKFTYGGLVYMANMIQTLKKQYNGNLLYLDAGDQFQGGIEASSKVSSGSIMADYFNYMNNQASAIGNHQFDFGPTFLQNYLSQIHSDLLAANLIDISTDNMPFKKQKRSQIYNFTINKSQNIGKSQLNQIRIGVIGLATLQTKTSTNGFIKNLFPQTFNFMDYKQPIEKQAQQLRRKGANAIIIVSHVGNMCDKSSQYGIWNITHQTTNNSDNPCKKDDQLFKLLDKLKQGTVDAIVQGHRHHQSHYFYKGVPIIGAINGGYYFNTIELTFSLNGKSVSLKKQNTKIQGPIPVCQRIFQKTKRCQYVPQNQLKDAGRLVEWNFHNQKVQADKKLKQIFDSKYGQKMKKYQEEIAKNYIQTPLINYYAADSKLGNLMTNVISQYMRKPNRQNLFGKIDFLIYNSGGFRTTFYPGILRQIQLSNMFPFDNYMVTFQIKGSILKELIQLIQNGEGRYYAIWGLQQIFSISNNKKRSQDKIRDKHLLTQEKLKHEKQYLKLQKLVSTLTKSQIQDEKNYRGATNDFLIGGGDDFHDVINDKKFKLQNIVQFPNIIVKDIVTQELKEWKEITEQKLQGPNNMKRIIIFGQDGKYRYVHSEQIQNIVKTDLNISQIMKFEESIQQR